ncbi:MAG: nucleotidyl transferase AbiEii/AbiGii toxin family protein, partial [Proteobacteria bacterium]|nr:nucleotidyl transferase AbiEii/AbiGii toxin family protein [Pseudomonadota bacterium]
EGVDYVLIGGFAVILYGMPRLTQDVDIFVRNDSDNIDRLQRALYDMFSDDSIREITVEELERYPVIRYGSPERKIPYGPSTRATLPSWRSFFGTGRNRKRRKQRRRNNAGLSLQQLRGGATGLVAV